MQALAKFRALPIGLALFSMFFGAGNTVFPLIVGQMAKDHYLFAIGGLLLTAAVLPMLGAVCMMRYEGNIQRFFGSLGKLPGILIALIIITLLGPFGSAPRCIALAFSTLKTTFHGLSPIWFSAAACGLIFFLSIKRSKLVSILGWILTPALLASLITIIFFGLFKPTAPITTNSNGTHLFFQGVKEGYHTMDLLAAFFFSSTILQLVKQQKQTKISQLMGSACLIGGTLLSLIYLGLSFLAAKHGSQFEHLPADQLLPTIAHKVAGPFASLLVASSVALACLTSAIALLSACTTFFEREVFKQKISYEHLLALFCTLTFFVSIFEFQTISTMLSPLIDLLYPGLIGLTFMNFFDTTTKRTPTKIVVFTLFILTTIQTLGGII